MQDACLLLKSKSKTQGSGPKGIQKSKINTVDITDPSVYESLKDEADMQNTSFRKYANDLLEMIAQKNTFMRRYMPKLSLLAFDDGIMFIKDREDGAEIAKVGLSKEGLVHCTMCDLDTCVHVMYALAMPQLGRMKELK